MRIGCSRCHAAYDIPDEKLQRAAVKIRCSQCGNLFVARRRPVEPAPEAGSAVRFEDFDFGSFGVQQDAAGEPASLPPEPDAAPAPRAPEPKAPAPAEQLLGDEIDSLPDLDSLNFDDLEIPALGELDLGDFDAQDSLEEPAASEPLEAPAPPKAALDREPLERVRREELVAPPPGLKEVPLQGVADDLPAPPAKGSRASPGKRVPSPFLARDRKRSPLLWFVLVAAATLGYTGYNVARHPEAFTFFDPAKLLDYWRSAQETSLTVDAKGYYRSFPSGRRAFVVRGEVINRSEKPQGLIRVKGTLFGDRGARLSVREAYCGNVLNDRELASLPRETIEARLQNQVGEALSNVDIAPGAKVPFMLVFVPPPDGVQKYKVSVSAARAGSGP